MRLRKRKQYRCGVCGHMFWGSDTCPAHPASVHIQWTDEMATAYRVQADRMREGKPPIVMDGIEGNRYELAARYVRAWEQEKEEMAS